MGKTLIYYFTPIQLKFLNALLAESYISEVFYLTGGTALAACYLNHRLSEDIDLFSQLPLDEPRITNIFSRQISPVVVAMDYVRIHDRIAYTLEFPQKQKLKVDVVHYPYAPLEKSEQTYQTLPIDSTTDIAVNKLMTISQRTEPKDFVDLYYLLKKYTLWDLRHGVEHKFKMDIEPFYLSSLLEKVEDLKFLPRMKKSLTLEELKLFFRIQAKQLGKRYVKP